jgi:N-acetylneuraminic acid mutarotase
VFGGYVDKTYRPTARVDRFDPASNTWTRMNDMPIPGLSHAGTATDGRFIYLAGGYPGRAGMSQTFSTTNVWKYDPVADSWTKIQSLPSARGAGAMVLNGRTLYFFGGADSGRADRKEMWSLDLDNSSATWVQRASMPAPRNHVGGAALNGLIYSVGGQTGQDAASVFKSDVFRYNPASNTWTSVAPLINQPRSHIANACFVRAGRIIVEGGEGPGRVALNNVESYDPSTNKWTALTPLPGSRSSGVGGVLSDGRIIFTGGFFGGAFQANNWIGDFV